MSWRRIRAHGVRSLEVWDAVIDGRPLYEVRPAERGRALAWLVDAAATGRLATESGGVLAVPGFDGVVITGGAALEVRAAVPVEVIADPWIGWAGARALVPEVAGLIDVGQSAIKLAWHGGHEVVPRPWERLPVVPPGRPPGPDLRPAFVDFVGAAAARLPGGPVVCALPTELDGDGLAHGCSYPFPVRDPTLLADLAATRPGAWSFLNDAELAAASVGALRPGRRWLVLTVGFGVGGAWVDAR